MPGEWQLWGTFSVLDHLRESPFLRDVVIFDRLFIPVPIEGDDKRWAQWQPDRQQQIIDILRDGDDDRVVEIPWDEGRQRLYEDRKAELAADMAADISQITRAKGPDPNSPGQFIERNILVDYANEERDNKTLARVRHGFPSRPVQVVAAYGTEGDFRRDTGAVQYPGGDPSSLADDLLAGLTWPFAVPAELGRSDFDLLKRAVEFANEPTVQKYREAFHRRRAEILDHGRSTQEATNALREEIERYGAWARREKTTKVAQGASLVTSVVAGVGGALLPLLGHPVEGAFLAAGGSLMPGVEKAAARLFRGRLASFAPGDSPGALFWEAQVLFS